MVSSLPPTSLAGCMTRKKAPKSNVFLILIPSIAVNSVPEWNQRCPTFSPYMGHIQNWDLRVCYVQFSCLLAFVTLWIQDAKHGAASSLWHFFATISVRGYGVGGGRDQSYPFFSKCWFFLPVLLICVEHYLFIGIYISIFPFRGRANIHLNTTIFTQAISKHVFVSRCSIVEEKISITLELPWFAFYYE